MRNILLFGPPASGKLSIANAIADIAPYVVIDNQRTIDAANLINTNQKLTFPHLSECLREWLYQTPGVHFVATVVYASGVDDALIEKYQSWLSREHSPCLLVQLHCSILAVKRRCSLPSRIGSTKITDSTLIDSLYAKYDFDSNHPNAFVMHVDTQIYSASEAAARIFDVAEQGAQPDALHRMTAETS